MSTLPQDLNSAGGISIDFGDAIAAAVESGDESGGDDSCGEEDDPTTIEEEPEESSDEDEGPLFDDDDDTAPPPQQADGPATVRPAPRAKSESIGCDWARGPRQTPYFWDPLGTARHSSSARRWAAVVSKAACASARATRRALGRLHARRK